MDLLNGRIAVVTGASNGIGRMSRVLVSEAKRTPFSWPTHS
jgi:NAD(P)-dependent dehydrogenase (short-subunit alcohol dehydrogenase family)